MKLAHLKRIGTSFLMVLFAYGVYLFLVVPLIEPRIARGPKVHAGTSSGRATDAFQNEIKDLFPQDAWEMGDAKVIRNGNATLLFKDFESQEDKTVRVFPCTAVIRPETEDQAPLILQAPEGAIVRLDRQLDLRSGQFGKPVGGRLLGKIRIYSPGRADGTGRLLIETSNVQITTRRLWTANEVTVQYDQSYALGSDLIIQLMSANQSKQERESQSWGGVRSIELVKLHELHLEPDATSKRAETADSTENTRSPDMASDVPIKVTCNGPFKIDFYHKKVTFEDQVFLRRLNPDGVEDTLQCERLQMNLISRHNDERLPSEAAAEPQKQSTPRLDPHRIMAEGQPAILDSPARFVHVSGHKLSYDLTQQTFNLSSNPQDAKDQVQFRFRTHQVSARILFVELHDERRLKRLQAQGPGVYRGLLNPKEKTPVQASWLGVLAINDREKWQVLTMRDAAQVRLGNDGRIDAHQIQLWFELLESQPGQKRRDALPVRPQRMIATAGEQQPVKVFAPELRAQTKKLDALIETVAVAQPATSRDTVNRQPRANNPIARIQSRKPSKRVMDVTCDQVEMILRLRGKEVAMRQIDLLGQTRLMQRNSDQPREPIFGLAADSVQIRDQDGRGSHVLVAVGQPADIQTDAFRLQTAKLQLDRGSNILWTDDAGRMSMQVDRDLMTGEPLPNLQSMSLDWRGTMRFDGEVAAFDGDVEVRTDQRRLRARQLAVQLDQRIDFAKTKSEQKPQIQKVQADGNVFVENHEVDKRGELISVSYLRVPHVRYDHFTGDAFAQGPGRLVTHRAGFNQMQLPAPTQPGNSTELRPKSEDGKITFVQVDFQRQFVGNVQRRGAEFQGQVKVIYGPVMSWNEMINPDQALGERDVLMSGDRLAFAEGPTNELGQRSVNVSAYDNIYVEGKTFTARGQRLSYEQAKKLLVLEGTARADAVLSHQARVGLPRTETVARKIKFWTDTQRVEIQGGASADISNLGL